MRIPIDAIMQLVEIGIQAFGKKRKVRRILEELHGAGGHYEDFIAAREKIDEAEAAGVGCTLTVEETAAIDFVMDRFAKGAAKIRREIRRVS